MENPAATVSSYTNLHRFKNFRMGVTHVSVQFSCSVVSDSETPGIAACQASLTITNSRSSLRFTSMESVMPSSHLILCRPLLLLPPIPPSIITLPTKVRLVKDMVFPVVMYGCESWTVKKAESQRIDAVLLEKTLESPLDCKEIQPVHSEGDQPWDFFGRNDAKAETPVLWPLHVKS